jgi:hypothetical protein
MKTQRQRRPLAVQDRARVMADIDRNSRTVGTQISQWAESAASHANEVARLDGASTAATDSLYWIRTYGVLADLAAHFERKLAFVIETEQGAPSATTRTYRSWFVAILAGIGRARDALTEEELLYLEYRRNVECHPFQDGYRLNIARAGEVIDTRPSLLLRKTLTIDATDAAIRAVLKRYRGEPAITLDFAKRTAGALRFVARLVRTYGDADVKSFARGPRSGGK